MLCVSSSSRTRVAITAAVAAFAFVFGAADRANAVISNPSFESGLAGWTTMGIAFPSGVAFGPIVPTHGSVQANLMKDSGVATIPTITTFLGIDANELAAALHNYTGTLPGSTGSAMKQTFNVASPTDVKFDYTLRVPPQIQPADVTAGYPTTVIATLDGEFWIVNDANTGPFPNTNGSLFWTNYLTFTGLPTLAPGNHTIGVAIIGSVSTGNELFVDNFIETPGTLPPGVPEPLTASLGALSLAALATVATRRDKSRG